MKSQACEPCAKRKVRCDREIPCSNCKRRKQDQCTYPDYSSTERIEKLETLVKSLQRDNTAQEHASPHFGPPQTPSHSDRVGPAQVDYRDNQPDKDPIVLEENGEPVHIESVQMPSPVTGASALQRILHHDPTIDLSQRHPQAQHATILWRAFNQNVNITLKIAFDWDLDYMRTAATSLDGSKTKFSAEEHAFIFAIYLISVLSMPDEECLGFFAQSKSFLLSEFQGLCEEALARSNLLAAPEFMVIQALTVYIAAGLDRLSIASIWSLMGIVIRNAERLALHRDGTHFGLSPANTERRRRVWWHLQHLDLALSVKLGYTSLTLMADWDTQLPLNIEDEDMNSSMEEFPAERKGITSMSHCLWAYWVKNEQRSFRRADGSRFGLSWISDKTLARDFKESLLDQVEVGLNSKFLQYCDPIKPLHNIIQLNARAFVCVIRRAILYSITCNEKDDNRREQLEREMIPLCIQSLRYDIIIQTNPGVKRFQWRTENFFQWNALLFIIHQAWRQNSIPEIDDVWEVLGELYSSVEGLWDFANDRKKPYIAALVLASWKAREQQPTPVWLANLESRLSTSKFTIAYPTSSKSKTALQTSAAEKPGPVLEHPDNDWFSIDVHSDPIINDLFGDIDWSFWENSIL